MASDVSVHWTVHQHMQPVLEDKIHMTPFDRWTLFPSCFRNTIGYLEHRPCGGTSWVVQTWYSDDSSRFSVKKSALLVQGHEDLGLTKVVVQEELDRVLYWILLATYINVCWSIYLSPVIIWLLLITIYILHNLSHIIYIFPTLYSWIFPIRLMNA